MPQHIKMYTTARCPDCRMVKRFLSERGISFEEIDIEEVPGAAELVAQATGGKRAVPTLDIDGHWVICSPFQPEILREALDLKS
ncbi:MAG: glutaredoxin family protein [Acidobacteriia bacterium]|nr:glutaredoxin family protein [Terriglobia bacterium]